MRPCDCSYPRYLIGLLGAGAMLTVAFIGCHNPANSSLPPSAISPPGAAVPPLPKGDIYADETVPTSETPIETGDTLEVIIRRGAGEEKIRQCCAGEWKHFCRVYGGGCQGHQRGCSGSPC